MFQPARLRKLRRERGLLRVVQQRLRRHERQMHDRHGGVLLHLAQDGPWRRLSENRLRKHRRAVRAHLQRPKDAAEMLYGCEERNRARITQFSQKHCAAADNVCTCDYTYEGADANPDCTIGAAAVLAQLVPDVGTITGARALAFLCRAIMFSLQCFLSRFD